MKSQVITELKRLANEHAGLLQPELVVVSARPKSSPLHSSFNWNDGKAAHLYRIWQARQLIRVSVEVLIGTEEKMDVFVSLSSDRERDGGGYRITTSVLSDEEMRDEMLADALADLECFREKYRRLKELAGIFLALKKIKSKRK